jgi:hypothetical protein
MAGAFSKELAVEDDQEQSQSEEGSSRGAARVRLRRRVALMVEHVQAIDGLLRDLQTALESTDAGAVGPPQLKALQDVSEILRECQQLSFSNASELIREMEGHPAGPDDGAQDRA